MPSKNREPLEDRVIKAAETVMKEQNYVSPVDVFAGIGWLDGGLHTGGRQGRTGCLERVIRSGPARVAEAMKLFGDWATRKGLQPSEIRYFARNVQQSELRFGISGDASVERLYRTHWVSPKLSEKKREQLQEKASRPPELVAISPLNRDWKCHRCSGMTDFLMMEDAGPSCMKCVGLGDLVFLAAGDTGLTRRVKAKSQRTAVVVRFSRSRKRYERQGILVEEAALNAAQSQDA
jgi:hypothetical protein